MNDLTSLGRKATQSEIDHFFGHKNEARAYQPGINVPDSKASDHLEYYVDSNNEFILKASAYDIDMKDTEDLIKFCKEKGWKFEIRMGLETWNPGKTFSIIYRTGKRLNQNNGPSE